MANPILNLLGGPLKGVIDGVGNLIDKVSTTDAERLAAKKDFLSIQKDLYTAALQADAEIAKSKAEVLKAEAQSESWLTRNWRPLVVLGFSYIVMHNYIFAPLFGFMYLQTPERLWDIIELSIGGYIAGRSVEKIIPSVATAIGDVTKAKKSK
jgi:hypothetical protein